MHELSIAGEVCRLAEERLGTDGASRLRVVAVVVGDEAGLEPDNLEFCLGALLVQPPFGGGRARITRVPGDDLRVEYLEVDDERSND